MEKNKQHEDTGGVTHKKEPNAGSGSFNQGSEQDPHYDEGVADGPTDPENISKEIQNPKTKLKKDTHEAKD
jgi:hypothetical protein